MNKPATKPMREAMPETTAFIDACRKAFGNESIDNSIRLGMQGYPDWFHATEGGREIGTPFKPTPNSISLANCVIRSREELQQQPWRNK